MKLKAAVTVAVAVISAIALSAQANADHDTVGGGSWMVGNSDSPCTVLEYSGQPYTACAGTTIYLPVSPGGSHYIVVPLGAHFSVRCDTFTPDGLLFESSTENLADVPRRQQYWAEQGWGPYVPEALCQLW
jgi:hypothetical protein